MSSMNKTKQTPMRGTPPAPHTETNPVQWAHALLRGRYLWAGSLALVLGAICAFVGYRSVTLEYQTTGYLRLRMAAPKVLYNTETSSGTHFDAFVDAQMQVLRSQRLADMAMSSDAWRSLRRGLSPADQARFQAAKNVWRASGSEIITVAFTDADRAATEAAVRAVIESFQRLFNENDRQQDMQILTLLDERRKGLTNELESVQKEIGQFGDVWGADGVEFLYRSLLDDERKLQQLVQETELQLTAARETARQAKDDPAAARTGAAVRDPKARALQDDIDHKQGMLAMLLSRLGDEHREVRQLRQDVQTLVGMLDSQLAGREHGEADQVDNPVVSPEARAVAELELRLQDLALLHTKTREQLKTATAQKEKLATLQGEASDRQRKLAEVAQRIEHLNFESALGGRLDVLSYGESSHEPINTKRQTQMAALGGMGGAAVGVGVFLLAGMLNVRLRSCDDLALGRNKVRQLGMLPNIPCDAGDPQQAVCASQCVHQIRMMLQLDGAEGEHRSFAISGPLSGTGKTSLTVALGFSFAASGLRTLLIDFDLVGGGLSHRLAAVRPKRLGRLLREHGTVEDHVIEETAVGGDDAAPLGERLLARGVLDRPRLDALLEHQRTSRCGVLEALAGEPLDHCIVPGPAPCLDVLPVGDTGLARVSRVSRHSVRALLREAKARYDVVLIDTGPAPGSAECSVIAAEADRVVAIVSRGDSMRRLNECLDYLRNVGAQVSGIVFNRADLKDLERSPYASSSARSRRSRLQSRGPAVVDPLAGALAAASSN